MRDNGYKNAAYAIAELIDNSIQAGARLVELLCVESEEQLVQRRRHRIQQVAVLDNGVGMNAEVLRPSYPIRKRNPAGRPVWDWKIWNGSAQRIYLAMQTVGGLDMAIGT